MSSSKSGGRPYWDQAEYIPRNLLGEVFRDPPDAPGGIERSTLIVGARGAGKTLLLDYAVENHPGVPLKLDLQKHLASLTSQAARGPASFSFTPAEARQIAGKATALLSVAITVALVNGPQSAPTQSLAACLPEALRSKNPPSDKGGLIKLRGLLEAAPLHLFEPLGEVRAFRAFVDEVASSQHGHVLLLFDRGDLVVSAALAPVFDLLDQASHYTAVLAMRPGIPAQAMPFIARSGLIPGDHYDLIHLGQYPRTSSWRSFVRETLLVQPPGFQRSLDVLNSEQLELVLDLTRDSIRWAVEVIWPLQTLAARYAGADPDATCQRALRHARTKRLRACRASLTELHRDVGEVVVSLRREAFQRRPPDRPLLLEIKSDDQQELAPLPTETDRLVALGLRHGLFSMPDGEYWHPGEAPRQVEVSPLLLAVADPEPRFCRVAKSPPAVVKRTLSGLLAAGGGSGARPIKIFVAHEMDDPGSAVIPGELRTGLAEYTSGRPFEVETGAGGAGFWADRVRGRIRGAAVVVADITNMRLDVLFELGYAHGLNKPIVPCVARREDLERVPTWLSRFDVSWYGDEAGINNTVSRCAQAATARRAKPTLPPPNAAVGVWLRPPSWEEMLVERFQTAARREQVSTDVIALESDQEDPRRQPYDSALPLSARAGLLIGTLDGREDDGFVHFVVGAAHGRGRAKNSPDRRVLVLVHPDLESSDRTVVAGSMASLAPSVQVLSARRDARRLRDLIQQYLGGIKRWRQQNVPDTLLPPEQGNL